MRYLPKDYLDTHVVATCNVFSAMPLRTLSRRMSNACPEAVKAGQSLHLKIT